MDSIPNPPNCRCNMRAVLSDREMVEFQIDSLKYHIFRLRLSQNYESLQPNQEYVAFVGDLEDARFLFFTERAATTVNQVIKASRLNRNQATHFVSRFAHLHETRINLISIKTALASEIARSQRAITILKGGLK